MVCEWTKMPKIAVINAALFPDLMLDMLPEE